MDAGGRATPERLPRARGGENSCKTTPILLGATTSTLPGCRPVVSLRQDFPKAADGRKFADIFFRQLGVGVAYRQQLSDSVAVRGT